MKKTLALDIGGTNIKIGIIDDQYHISEHKYFKTQKSQISKQIEIIVQQELLLNPTIDSIAIASTGVVNSMTKKIVATNQNLKNYQGTDFNFLANKFQIPLAIINDANAAALAELIDPNCVHKNFITITFGTGVGAGIIFNRQIYQGKNFLNGEFGYSKMGHSKVDHFLSFSRFCARQKKIHKIENSCDALIAFNHLFEVKLEFKKEILAYLKRIANFLSNLAIFLNLEHIYVAGGIAHLDNLFLEHLYYQFQANINQTPFKTTISISQFKNNAGLIGATYFLRNNCVLNQKILKI